MQHGRKLARFHGKPDKTGDAVGRPSCPSSLLSDPNATFSVEMWRKPQRTRKIKKQDVKRNEKMREGVETQVYSDVDSAYATLSSDIDLLKPYKRQYLEQAVRVRDTVLFSYQHGGAALLDFLN